MDRPRQSWVYSKRIYAREVRYLDVTRILGSHCRGIIQTLEVEDDAHAPYGNLYRFHANKSLVPPK